jgi:co-chaperonin GroES (HSP10)
VGAWPPPSEKPYQRASAPGTDVKVDGEDRLILREDEVLGIVE